MKNRNGRAARRELNFLHQQRAERTARLRERKPDLSEQEQAELSAYFLRREASAELWREIADAVAERQRTK